MNSLLNLTQALALPFSFFVVLTSIQIYRLITRPTIASMSAVVGYATMIFAVIAFGSTQMENRNLVSTWLMCLSTGQVSVWLSTLAGGICAATLQLGMTASENLYSVLGLRRGVLLTIPFVLIGLSLTSSMLADSRTQPADRDPNGLKSHQHPYCSIDVFAEFDEHTYPVRVAIDDNERVFVSALWGLARQQGRVLEILPDGLTGRRKTEVVAMHLNRPFGLIAHHGDLYVSRSGQHTVAKNGNLKFINTGAVTRLRDMNGDGVFDHFHDVLSGLPGSRSPDYLHQNNGIVFDEHDHLFVTVGSPGQRRATMHRYEGAILRLSPDFEDVEVYARGFRNPYGITLTPDGAVFVTDNDVDIVNDGDELNHVRRGQHYGHPYVLGIQTDPSGQTTAPVWMTPSSLTSVISSPKVQEIWGCDLLLLDAGRGQLLGVTITPDGETFQASIDDTLPKIENIVDVAISPRGDLFAISYQDRVLYRIRHHDSSNE